MNLGRTRPLAMVSLAFLFCLCLLATQGCGPAKQTGDIRGNVICGGEPVLVGEVMLQDAEGHCYSGGIKDGHFTVVQVPVGSMQVTVTGIVRPFAGDLNAIHKRRYALMEAARKKAEKAGQKFSSSDFDDPAGVPKKYSTTRTSGLTFEVKPGTQNFDLDLEGPPQE